jgi:hypothetical protein
MSELDPLAADMFSGAAAALRRRADRQAKIAKAGTTRGDRGVSVRTGEAAIAARLAAVFSKLAHEFESEQPDPAQDQSDEEAVHA